MTSFLFIHLFATSIYLFASSTDVLFGLPRSMRNSPSPPPFACARFLTGITPSVRPLHPLPMIFRQRSLGPAARTAATVAARARVAAAATLTEAVATVRVAAARVATMAESVATARAMAAAATATVAAVTVRVAVAKADLEAQEETEVGVAALG